MHTFLMAQTYPIFLTNYSLCLFFFCTFHLSFYVCQFVCLCTQLCPTFCSLVDGSQPGFSVHGILQAIMLERVAISSCRGSPLTQEVNPASPTLAGRFLTTEPPGKPIYDSTWCLSLAFFNSKKPSSCHIASLIFLCPFFSSAITVIIVHGSWVSYQLCSTRPRNLAPANWWKWLNHL